MMAFVTVNPPPGEYLGSSCLCTVNHIISTGNMLLIKSKSDVMIGKRLLRTEKEVRSMTYHSMLPSDTQVTFQTSGTCFILV